MNTIDYMVVKTIECDYCHTHVNIHTSSIKVIEDIQGKRSNICQPCWDKQVGYMPEIYHTLSNLIH